MRPRPSGLTLRVSVLTVPPVRSCSGPLARMDSRGSRRYRPQFRLRRLWLGNGRGFHRYREPLYPCLLLRAGQRPPFRCRLPLEQRPRPAKRLGLGTAGPSDPLAFGRSSGNRPRGRKTERQHHRPDLQLRPGDPTLRQQADSLRRRDTLAKRPERLWRQQRSHGDGRLGSGSGHPRSRRVCH